MFSLIWRIEETIQRNKEKKRQTKNQTLTSREQTGLSRGVGEGGNRGWGSGRALVVMSTGRHAGVESLYRTPEINTALHVH